MQEFQKITRLTEQSLTDVSEINGWRIGYILDIAAELF